MDNASANSVLCETLRQILQQKYDIHFDEQNGQVRCFAHALNRVAQKILSVLGDCEDPESVDYFHKNRHLPQHYNPAEDPVIAGYEEEGNVDEELDKISDAMPVASFATELEGSDSSLAVEKVCCPLYK